MKRFLIALLFCAGGISFACAAGGFACEPHAALVKDIIARRQQGFLATAIAKPGLVLQIFVNGGSGDFTVIGVGDDGRACALLQGTDWVFAAERKI
jgi:hypothetical protein